METRKGYLTMNLWKKQPQLTLLAQRITQQFTTALQVVSYSLFFSHVTFISYVYAGPTGGVVVGGAGNISQSGLTTTVNQTNRGQTNFTMLN